MSDVSTPEYLTTSEVMERCRVSRSTISRWRKTGVLEGVKVGGGLRFRAADVDRLFEPTSATEATS